MVHITTHGCSAQLHPQLVDVRQMDASQVLLPENASRHMQATCVHTRARTHMQAHVLTCVNCKRTARRKHTCTFCIYTLRTCTKHGRQSRPPTRDQRHPHRKPTRLEPHWPAPRRPRCIAPSEICSRWAVSQGILARHPESRQGAHCREMRKRDAVWTSCTVVHDIASLSDRQRPPLCLAIRFDVDNIDVVRTRLPT